MNKTGRTLFLSTLIGGSVLLASAQVAFADANDRMNFNSFRDQNPELDRHAARKMFRAERRNEDRAVNPAQFLNNAQVFGRGGQARFGAETTSKFRQADRFNQEQIRRNTFQSTDAGRDIRVNNGVNLDLTSNTRNIVLGNGLFGTSSSVVITVGGQTRTVSAGEQVTASEYVAVKQALTGDGQTVIIDVNGAAIGGQVDLGQLTADNDVMRASNLVVSANVTTSGDFGKRSDFRLLGDLSNFGTVHATSTSANVRSGAIRAENIANHSSGLITSDVNLTLDAAATLSNEGTISSSQGLTLSAGQAVNNRGTVTAAGDVNFNAPTVNNAGRVQSTNGNINLNGSETAALLVNNYGGTLKALDGAINLRNTAYSGTYESLILGGDLFSRDVNLNSGQGLASVHVQKLTGLVHESGLAAHVSAATDTLNIGNVCLTGDPTFYNTLGGINITGNVLVGEALTLVATGDITSNDGAITVQAGTDAQGFNITFIAGAAFTASGGGDSPTIPPGNGAGTVTLSGKASSTGGSIILGSGTQVIARSTEVVVGGNDAGGDILFAAFAGKGDGSGRIDISEAGLYSGGRSLGSNGDIKLVAGAKSGTGVITGIIDTTGGAPALDQGNIKVYNKQPGTSIKKEPVVYDPTGARTSTAEIVQTGKLTKSSTEVRNIAGEGTESASEILFDAGANLLINGDILAVGGINLRAPNGNIFMDPNSISVADVTSTDGLIELFSSKGTIGTDANPIRINTENFSAETAKGPLINIESTGTGQVFVDFLVAKGTARVTSPVGILNFVEPIEATNIELDVFDINGIFALGESNKGGNLSITITDPLAIPANGTLNKAENVYLNFASGIGTSGNPIVIDNAKEVTLVGPSVYVTQNSKKATVYSITAEDEVSIGAANSMIINGASVSNGSFDANVGTGTITVDGDIITRDGVSLVSGNAKSKIVVSAGVNIATTTTAVGDGNIIFSIGANAPTPAPGPFDNIQINENGGSVVVQGAGIAGKAPLNSLSANGGILLINNGAKSAKNILLEGDVEITAQPD